MSMMSRLILGEEVTLPGHCPEPASAGAHTHTHTPEALICHFPPWPLRPALVQVEQVSMIITHAFSKKLVMARTGDTDEPTYMTLVYFIL